MRFGSLDWPSPVCTLFTFTPRCDLAGCECRKDNGKNFRHIQMLSSAYPGGHDPCSPLGNMKSTSGAIPVELDIRREIERYNALLRHCSGVSYEVLKQALQTWEELWMHCQDPRSADEILDGVLLAPDDLPRYGWSSFLEKLHLLGHYLHSMQRLLARSLDPKAEGPQIPSHGKEKP